MYVLLEWYWPRVFLVIILIIQKWNSSNTRHPPKKIPTCKSQNGQICNKSMWNNSFYTNWDQLKKEFESMFGKICTYNVKHVLQIKWTFSRSSRHFLDPSDTLQIIRILFRSSKIVKTLFIASWPFSDHSDTLFLIVLNRLDTVQIIWTFCRSSAYFLYHLVTPLYPWILSGSSK